MSALVRAGLVPRSYLLTTQGRKTGRPRTNPVCPVEHGGRRWLVAPYGPVSWVRNARATGHAGPAGRQRGRRQPRPLGGGRNRIDSADRRPGSRPVPACGCSAG